MQCDHGTNYSSEAFFLHLATNTPKFCPGTLWDQYSTYVPKRHIALKTKIRTYKTMIVPCMIYSSESWNCTKKEIRKLEGLQYRQLRSIFGKTWKDRISHVQLLQSIKFGPNFNFNWAVSDEDKTKDPNLSSVETMIRLSRLRYCGHVLRMIDHRLPKQIRYPEADLGERSRGRPKKNF